MWVLKHLSHNEKAFIDNKNKEIILSIYDPKCPAFWCKNRLILSEYRNKLYLEWRECKYMDLQGEGDARGEHWLLDCNNLMTAA